MRNEKSKETVGYATMQDSVHKMNIPHDMPVMTKEHVKNKIHKVVQKQMMNKNN